MKLSDEMREVFGRWKSSGLSLMAFGKVEGISYQKLLYWRNKLGDEARRDRTRGVEPCESQLVPLRVVPDSLQAEPEPEKFELWFANGTSLDIAPGFDEHELRRLVGMLLTC